MQPQSLPDDPVSHPQQPIMMCPTEIMDQGIHYSMTHINGQWMYCPSTMLQNLYAKSFHPHSEWALARNPNHVPQYAQMGNGPGQHQQQQPAQQPQQPQSTPAFLQQRLHAPKPVVAQANQELNRLLAIEKKRTSSLSERRLARQIEGAPPIKPVM